ncbi:MAG: polysaccharide deacetylase family protein [Terracidiphilus sp.]
MMIFPGLMVFAALLAAAGLTAPAALAAPRTARLSAHPVVALTFDDLPDGGGLSPDDTRTRIATALAATLKAHHLKGTYGFVNAVGVNDDPDLQQALRAWLAAGMNIGNHTWSHPSLSRVTAAAYERNIAQDKPLLAAYAGARDWHWFRYPYLEEGDTLAKRRAVRAWLGAHGYRIAQVTLNFNDDDWQDPYGRCLAQHNIAAIDWLEKSYLENAAEFIRVGREEEQIAFGHEIPNVLLLHETAFTTLMLPRLLDQMHREGFRFKSLARVEQNRAYARDPDAALPDGGTLPNEYLNSRHLPYPPFTPEPVDQLNSLCTSQ